MLLIGRVSLAELTCETLILLSTNLTGSLLSDFLSLCLHILFWLKVLTLLCVVSVSEDVGGTEPDVHHQ